MSYHPVISAKQFDLLKSLKAGDVVSFKEPKNKNFGTKELVNKVENDGIVHNIHTTHLQRKLNYVHWVNPYHPTDPQTEIKKH